MFPQYTPRRTGGELAIWLLITVGALLIPTIVVAICCIRHHLLKTNRKTGRPSHMKQMEALRSYNGPYHESNTDDEVGLSLEHNKILTYSLKKQHVHWLDGSTISTTNNTHTNKTKKIVSEKKPSFIQDHFNTIKFNESPSLHRHPFITLTSSSLNFNHVIPTMINPVGSAIENIGTSQWLTSSKCLTSISLNHNCIV